MNPLGLSDREVLIVWAWATGRNSRWIAEFTGRTVSTIGQQQRQLRKRLGARSNTHAVAIVLREILGHAPKASLCAPAAAPDPWAVSVKQLGKAARRAVREGVDPWLALSYVMWPPYPLTVAA